jgi:hypothetical protein
MSRYGRDVYEESAMDREEERAIEERGHNGHSPQSVASLVGDLIGETSALVQAEMALARSEMRDNVESIRRGASMMGGGAGLTHAGLLAIVAAAVLLLDRIWPAWVAALVVGVAAALIGGIAMALGKRRATREGMRPQRTLHSLGEMRELARQEKTRAMRKWQ